MPKLSTTRLYSAFVILVPLLAAAVLSSRPAIAGEQPLVNLLVTDAGSASATVFGRPKVEFQAPDAGAWISVDGRAVCNPGYPCILLPAGALLTTTVKQTLDGGLGRVTATCLSGQNNCAISVFTLEGNEGL